MSDNPGSKEAPGLIPPHGGYRDLQSFQMSELVYDGTVKFCDRFRSYQTYSSFVENAPAEVAANTLLCLVHQTNYLLDQQLRQLEQAFLAEGGFTERLYRARQQARVLPARPSFGRNRTSKADRLPLPSSGNQPNSLPPKPGATKSKPPAHV